MIKSLKVKNSDSECCEVASPSKKGKNKLRYPYGTTLTMNDELLKKFPDLMKANAGDVFDIKGKVKVTIVKKIDADPANHYDKSSVELQVTDIEFDKDDDLDTAFNED